MLKKVFVSLLLALIVAFSLTSCKNDDDTVDGSSDFESEDDSSVDGSLDSTEQNGEVGGNVDSELESDIADGGTSDEENGSSTSDSEESGDSAEGGDGEDPETVDYVYSINSTRYHLPSCYYVSVMKESTRVDFKGTIEELSASGFTPCRSCKPDPNFNYENTENDGDENDSEAFDYCYLLNSSSMKFHLPSCSTAENMNQENKVYSNELREELIIQGYSPCGNCNP